jgi:uncharacterized flavoprotein (TIGR03862 family)
LNNITIIGGGSASLFFASFLDERLFNINIYEQKKSGLGRKFLVAGDGGFNLTHSENNADFIARYAPQYFLEDAIQSFNNQQLIDWLYQIGIPTFIGTSKRVYPEKGIKPIAVLNAIKNVLDRKKTKSNFNKTFTGWDQNNNPIFNNDEIVKTDYCVFALGGGSWEITGSNGEWLDTFTKKGIKTTNFQPSNCAFNINWDIPFITKNEGLPLKNIAITCDGKTQKGEVVITKFGIEGNAIYALSPQIRSQLDANKKSEISLDLKPTMTENKILSELTNRSSNITTTLKKSLKLSLVQIQLLKSIVSKTNFTNPNELAKHIKHLTITINNSAPVDEAISTVGGVNLSEVNPYFELKKIPNHFCIGEMLNWDAPTGGYLLQGCASMGAYLADYLNKKQLKWNKEN